MSIYARSILPRLIDLGNRSADEERARLVPLAAGDVLEIGIGSALNVRHYPPAVRALLGVDPSTELWRIGRHRLGRASFPAWYVTASGGAGSSNSATFRNGVPAAPAIPIGLRPDTAAPAMATTATTNSVQRNDILAVSPTCHTLLISAYACAGQNSMFISSYSPSAVLRWSSARVPMPARRYSLPSPRWQ